MKCAAFILALALDATEALNLFRFGRRSTMRPKKADPKFTLPVTNQRPPGFQQDDPPVKPDKDIVNVFSQNQAWKKMVLESDPTYFEKLGVAHRPQYLFLGCSDASVPESVIMGEEMGNVLAVRNFANMVVNTDSSGMAAILYGVQYLKIPHIIVCGHYDCGGIRAAQENRSHGAPLENWLCNIRDVYRLHRNELDRIKNPEKRHRRLVELNVVEQCINLYKSEAIQAARLASYQHGATTNKKRMVTPRIHPCVFDPKTGDMMRLNVKLEDYMTDLGEIYNMSIEVS